MNDFSGQVHPADPAGECPDNMDNSSLIDSVCWTKQEAGRPCKAATWLDRRSFERPTEKLSLKLQCLEWRGVWGQLPEGEGGASITCQDCDF